MVSDSHYAKYDVNPLNIVGDIRQNIGHSDLKDSMRCLQRKTEPLSTASWCLLNTAKDISKSLDHKM